MKQSYLQYYDRYSIRAPIRFLWDSLPARPSAKKHSLVNRTKDYYPLRSDSNLLALHREINLFLSALTTEWAEYDYGEGYCYQSMDAIGVSGLRNTRARVEAMGLMSLSENRSIIDVGCNMAFLALDLAKVASRIIGSDVNPHLIDIGGAAASYLKIDNVELVASSFEDFSQDDPVDIVLSLANHSTYDGKTEHTLEEYFDKCRHLLKSDGLLIFESHHPEYEAERLEGVISVIQSRFEILNREILHYGTRMDQGRTFITARPKPDS